MPAAEAKAAKGSGRGGKGSLRLQLDRMHVEARKDSYERAVSRGGLQAGNKSVPEFVTQLQEQALHFQKLRSIRPDYLTSVLHKTAMALERGLEYVLADMESVDNMASATTAQKSALLKNLAIVFGILHEHERLALDKSTQNIGFWAKVVKQGQAELETELKKLEGPTPQGVVVEASATEEASGSARNVED